MADRYPHPDHHSALAIRRPSLAFTFCGTGSGALAPTSNTPPNLHGVDLGLTGKPASAGFFCFSNARTRTMDDFNKQGMSAARRRAESIIRTALDESSLKREQEKQREAMAAKTARLRELRLAKEAAAQQAERPKAVRRQKRKGWHEGFPQYTSTDERLCGL